MFAALAVCLGWEVGAWEGHEWNQWRKVTTWEKPTSRTDQAGRKHLAPLLGSAVGSTNRTEALRRWEERRKLYEQTIQGILGGPGSGAHGVRALPSDFKMLPVEVKELGSEELDGYTRRHIMIRSEPEDWIPAYLLIPKHLTAARVPAMLCLHQTVAQGKEEPCDIKGDPELAFAVELVKRGFVCLAPDAIGFGERIPAGKQPYHDSAAFYRKHPNWSFMGKMVWDTGRAIDYLETLPMVDSKHIGSIGHSHGAYETLFAAAFEPRISAAVASCGFTTFRSDPNPERWSHLTALIPQLGCYLPDVASIPFDWQHVLALTAPRHLFVWYATQDTIFPHTDNLDGVLKDVQTVYRLHGATDALSWQVFAGPHKFPKTGREQAYRWLEAAFTLDPGTAATNAPRAKVASAFLPANLVAHAQANARTQDWAAAIRDSLVAAAKPWMGLSDDYLWSLMFGNTLRRAWQVWSDGYCPACKKPVPMYEWKADALNQPWKMRCPQCKELFPMNDFLKYYQSGLNTQGLFEPQRADRSLLFSTEHPSPSDPLHSFGVDDGEGYVADGHRWRFINAYLIYGQWKQAIVDGIRNLAAAHVATGDPAYAHKAGVLFDRMADFYPTFDFGKEGIMYEGAPRSGYVSTWHDACFEVNELALAYDAVFESLSRDKELVTFLSAKAKQCGLANRKSSFTDIQRNIEDRIFQDTLNNRPKIESNYPATDAAIVTLHTVLGWPGNRAEVLALLDGIISKATLVDGLTGEKGLAGYALIAPHAVAALLGRYARADPGSMGSPFGGGVRPSPGAATSDSTNAVSDHALVAAPGDGRTPLKSGFIRTELERHPRLHDMYRFHLDTWCLGQYYPRSGDTGSFAARSPQYVGLPFTTNPGVNASSYSLLWELYLATGDKDFVRLIYHSNGGSVRGLPYDLFAADPAGFQAQVAKVIAQDGAEFKLGSVNKTEWGLAILRSGEGTNARAAWMDYDSGERHGHADGLTIGLFAKGLDLLPDFGYPPVQYGGWTAPRAVWYTQTAAHNTVTVDGKNHRAGSGKTTLWFEGSQFRVVRASAKNLIGGRQFERTLALVDISPAESYVVDVLRVNAGKEHTRFLYGHFGRLTTTSLALAATNEVRYGEVMRGFQRDPRPAPGWTADWAIEDHLHYLANPADLHLRLTDLTRGAEVETAEAWVSVSQYGGTADAWIPSMLMRRRTDEPPLASTFVGVLEPYEGKPKVHAARRLELRDSVGNPCTDGFVAVETQLADGSRDLFISTDVENSPGGSASVGEPKTGAQFGGDLCIVRRDKANRPTRVLFGRGRWLRLGDLVVVAKDYQASFEIDLERPESPIVAGPAEAVANIEVGGVKLWPK
jgi:oligo-alginate lyase